MMIFWKNVKYLMTKKGLTFGGLANLVKIHSGHRPCHTRLKANVEGRKSISPSVETVETYSRMFQVSMDDLLYVDLSERERLLF